MSIGAPLNAKDLVGVVCMEGSKHASRLLVKADHHLTSSSGDPIGVTATPPGGVLEAENETIREPDVFLGLEEIWVDLSILACKDFLPEEPLATSFFGVFVGHLICNCQHIKSKMIKK